jgi:hypothetical protein
MKGKTQSRSITCPNCGGKMHIIIPYGSTQVRYFHETYRKYNILTGESDTHPCGATFVVNFNRTRNRQGQMKAGRIESKYVVRINGEIVPLKATYKLKEPNPVAGRLKWTVIERRADGNGFYKTFEREEEARQYMRDKRVGSGYHNHHKEHVTNASRGWYKESSRHIAFVR